MPKTIKLQKKHARRSSHKRREAFLTNTYIVSRRDPHYTDVSLLSLSGEKHQEAKPRGRSTTYDNTYSNGITSVL